MEIKKQNIQSQEQTLKERKVQITHQIRKRDGCSHLWRSTSLTKTTLKTSLDCLIIVYVVLMVTKEKHNIIGIGFHFNF